MSRANFRRGMSGSAGALAAVVAASLLAGCGAGDEEGLRQWMASARSAKVPPPPPLPEPKPYAAREYAARNAPEPFAQTKIGELSRALSESPEANRPREALEDFPLENFRMMGSMRKAGQTYAIVQVDNKVHHIKVGQYLGQSYGRVVRITDQEIVLRELVREGVGEWKEKMTSLKLEVPA